MINDKEFELILYFSAFLAFACFIALLFTREFKEFSSELLVKKSAAQDILSVDHVIPEINNAIKSDVVLNYELINYNNLFIQKGSTRIISNHVYDKLNNLLYDDVIELYSSAALDLNDDLTEIHVSVDFEPPRSVSPLQPQMMTYKSFFPCLDIAPA